MNRFWRSAISVYTHYGGMKNRLKTSIVDKIDYSDFPIYFY